MTMRLLNSLRTAIVAATAALLCSGAQAGPMPTHVAAMKSTVDPGTTEVRWGGGWRGGGYGYRGGGFRGGGFRGGGWGYRGGYGGVLRYWGGERCCRRRLSVASCVTVLSAGVHA